MSAKSMCLLLFLSVGWPFAPVVSAAPPQAKEHDGESSRASRDQSDQDVRSGRDPDSHRGRPMSDRGPGGSFDHGGMMRMMPIVSTLDADSDGNLSSEEIQNASAALKKLDKNDDGKVDMSELRPQFAGRLGPPPRGSHEVRRSPRRDGYREAGRQMNRRGGYDARGRQVDRGRSRGPAAYGRDNRRSDWRGDRRNGNRRDHGVQQRGPRDQDRSRDGERARDRDHARDQEHEKRSSNPRDKEDGANGGDQHNSAPPMLHALMQLDQNDDGDLSADELTKLHDRGQRMIKMGDRDEDGMLSSEELDAMKERGQRMRRDLQKPDSQRKE